MDTTTPSAGPAPVEYTTERYRALLEDALRIARDPSTLLLPTREHLQVLHHQMMQAVAARTEAATLIIAFLLSDEKAGAAVPVDVLADIRRQQLLLSIDVKTTPGYVQVAVHHPARANGRPS